MNENRKDEPRKRFSWVRLLLVAVPVVIVVGLLFPAPISGHRTSKRQVARLDVTIIRAALKHYIVEFVRAPVGDHAQIMTLLRGKNPRQIVFFEADAKRFNPRGEFLDPWGAPYRIDASNPEFPWAYSFGPNTTDEGGAKSSDDISSWQ